MLKIKIDIEDISKSLDLSSKLLMKEMTNSMEDIVDEGKKIMKQEAPEGTGDLRKSIETKVKNDKKGVVGTIDPTAKYADAVEEGRSKGGVANIASIKRWLAAKGLPMSYAGGIAVKASKGKSTSNKPNPYAQRTFDKLQDIVEDELNKAIDKALRPLK